MAIPLLNLDDRTFQDMIEEVQALIPRHAPTWTNHNLSDPGITLLELFAWVTEAMLFRINRVPESSRRRFLELLGAAQQTARPATLKVIAATVELQSDLSVPRHTRVLAYTDPLTDAIPFETVAETTFTEALPIQAITLRQTAATTVQAIGSGEPFQLVRLTAAMAAPVAPFAHAPRIWIGSGAARSYWHYVPTLRTSTAADRHFTIRADGGAVIFGNGRQGMIPPAGAPITISYRSAADAQGMVRSRVLRLSNGAPNQVIPLAEAPLPADLQPRSDLEPGVEVAGAAWAFASNVLDFEAEAPEFSVEPWSNALRFGNGARGQIPVRGAEIRVRYRATLGQLPPLPAATSFVFDASLPCALHVHSFRVLDPGAMATSLDEARAQAFALLKPRWRSVTAADFAEVLGREVNDIHRVQCAPGDDLAESAALQPAKVGVLVTPRPRHRLEGAATKIGAPIQLAPDGLTLVASRDDGSVWLWNLAALRAAACLSLTGVNSVRYTGDGARIVVVANDGATALYDARTGVQRFPSAALPAPLVTRISLLSPDDRRWFTVTTGAQELAVLRTSDDGMPFAVLAAAAPTTCAIFMRGGTQLATAHAPAGDDGAKAYVRLWDTGNGKDLGAILETDAAVEQLVADPSGQCIAAVGADGVIVVWNPTRRGRLTTVSTGGPVQRVAIDATATRLATLSQGGDAHLWSLHTGAAIAALHHAAPVAGVIFSPDGRSVATFDQNGVLHLWDAQDGHLQQTFAAEAPIAALAFERRNRRLSVVTMQPPSVRVWDLKRPAAPILERSEITSATLHNTGAWVAWTEDNLAVIWDALAGHIDATLHHRRDAADLRFLSPSTDSDLVLTMTQQDDGSQSVRRLHVWNAGVVEAAEQTLAGRHLLTSEIQVRGPAYVDIGLRATLVRSLPPKQDLAALVATVERALLQFFDPLTGGPDGAGWPLGRDLYRTEVYQVMEQTAGVDHVESLSLFLAAAQAPDRSAATIDFLPIPPHHLPNCVIAPESIQILDPARLPFAVTP